MIKCIFPNIIGSNVFQIQTSSTPHYLLQIALYSFSGSVSGVLVPLTLLDIQTVDLLSNKMRGACNPAWASGPSEILRYFLMLVVTGSGPRFRKPEKLSEG